MLARDQVFIEHVIQILEEIILIIYYEEYKHNTKETAAPLPTTKSVGQSQCEILLKIINVNTTDVSEQVDPDSLYHTAWQDSLGALLHVNYNKPLELQVGSTQLQEIPAFLISKLEITAGIVLIKTCLKAIRTAGKHHSWDKFGLSPLAKKRLFRLEKISW